MATHSHNGQSSSSLSFPKKSRPVRRDDCLVQDCQNLAKLDYETPFRDIFDAVDRLMPFHILYSENGYERDNGFAKRKLFQANCERKAREFHCRSEAIQSRLELLEKTYSNPKRRRPEEEYRLEKLASHSVREFYVNEKLALRGSSRGPSIRPNDAALSTSEVTRKPPALISALPTNQDKLLPPPRLGPRLQLSNLEFSTTDLLKRDQ